MSNKENKPIKEYQLTRLFVYSIEDFLTDYKEFDSSLIKRPLTIYKEYYHDGNKYKVKMSSKRYKVFSDAYRYKEKIVCCNCGLEASHFVLEQHPHQFKMKNYNPTKVHFNLYGIDADGTEILFTKDHIIPVSKGGTDALWNMQVLCTHCNLKKGNKIEGVI